MESRLAAAAFVVVFATYLFIGGMGVAEGTDVEAKGDAYNLLAAGLLSGHLYLAETPPPGLLRLPNPYDPAANATFRTDPELRLHDLSFYKGRLYLYFGIAPALLLFTPWHLLTGAWLPTWAAVIAVCSAGALLNILLLRSIRSREFPGAPAWTTSLCALVLGLGSYAPILLSRASLWEVPIAFNYLCVSAAHWGLWAAFCRPAQAARWIALASGAMGLALLSRASVLPVAAILVLPFLSREARRDPRRWAAAALPIAGCGALAAIYNLERFGSPFEFGTRYMLSGGSSGGLPSFSPAYFWTNVHLHLFKAVEWLSVFPYAHEPDKAFLLGNWGGVEHMSGVLLNSPFLWTSLAAAVCLRRRGTSREFVLIATAVTWVTLVGLGTFLFFCGANSRYQFEYVPGLAFAACLGLLAIEGDKTAIPRVPARWVWVPALLMTATFPVLYGIDRCVEAYNAKAVILLLRGDPVGAGREVETAKFLSPGNPKSRLISALMLERAAPAESLAEFESVARDFPRYATGHYFLANALTSRGRWDDAVGHYRKAHDLDPSNAAYQQALAKAQTHAQGK